MPDCRHPFATFLTFAALAVSTAGAVQTASAAEHLVELQVVDRQAGEALPSWRYRGASYVAGRPGDRYAVRLVNRSAARVLVVLSIDGVNAVSGETAAVGQTGYVLAPHASAEITGWRKSYAEAAAFYFTSLPDSYAARTDRPGNVGVIGAAVFRELAPTPIRRWPAEAPVVGATADTLQGAAAPMARPAPSASADESQNPSQDMQAARPSEKAAEASTALRAKAERLGTGHGEREYSPTGATSFERASEQPAQIVQLRYDSMENLLAAGVVPRPAPLAFAPEPFPGFVRDPR
jgi:hypothetical protein